jgi:hypothetical protein
MRWPLGSGTFQVVPARSHNQHVPMQKTHRWNMMPFSCANVGSKSGPNL